MCRGAGWLTMKTLVWERQRHAENPTRRRTYKIPAISDRPMFNVGSGTKPTPRKRSIGQSGGRTAADAWVDISAFMALSDAVSACVTDCGSQTPANSRSGLLDRESGKARNAL